REIHGSGGVSRLTHELPTLDEKAHQKPAYDADECPDDPRQQVFDVHARPESEDSPAPEQPLFDLLVRGVLDGFPRHGTGRAPTIRTIPRGCGTWRSPRKKTSTRSRRRLIRSRRSGREPRSAHRTRSHGRRAGPRSSTRPSMASPVS